jgi:hypothetical protein
MGPRSRATLTQTLLKLYRPNQRVSIPVPARRCRAKKVSRCAKLKAQAFHRADKTFGDAALKARRALEHWLRRQSLRETDNYYSNQVIHNVRLWADIVRTRIQLARERTTLKPTLRITYAVQQLFLMLSDLARQCSRTRIALRLLDPQLPRSANGPLRSDATLPG